jgi:hypothetical protein
LPHVITKFDWLTSIECLPGAWFGLREPKTTPDEAAKFRMEQGQEVGALARLLYPSGVLVSPQANASAAEETAALIADAGIDALFEATFCAAPFVAKADILRREDGAWHVLEVKSSFSDTKSINALIDDLAYTVWVFRRAGLKVNRASLLLLSRGYRFGDPPERLFEVVERTDDVDAKVQEFETSAAQVVSILFGDEPPAPSLRSACRYCERFGETCLRTGAAHTVLEIPNLHHTKLKRLSAAGIIDLADLPDDVKLNERQERAKYSSLSGNTVIEPGLAEALAAVEWPCHYLDFETVAAVLPLYEGHGCHRQVLTQFSIHHRDQIDAAPGHSEYLADAQMDCERELAEALIKALGGGGSIIVYSDFEQKRIEGLRERFPDLADQLTAILNRLIDLLPIIQDHVYHPDFHGSFSIKHVLPALVPSLSYEGLDIRNGDMAIARFAGMARGAVSGAEVETTRRQLLEYCKLDTFAMVSLHEVLYHLATARRSVAG